MKNQIMAEISIIVLVSSASLDRGDLSEKVTWIIIITKIEHSCTCIITLNTWFSGVHRQWLIVMFC